MGGRVEYFESAIRAEAGDIERSPSHVVVAVVVATIAAHLVGCNLVDLAAGEDI